MTPVARTSAWSQLQMFTRAPPSTIDRRRAAADGVARLEHEHVEPARARYAAHVRPL